MDKTSVADGKSSGSIVPEDRLLKMLRGQFQPLLALVDAARDVEILRVLLESKEECESLFEGAEGGMLAHFAPYLVRLSPQSPLLETLVREGWGKGWCVFLTSDKSFEELHRHFRHFLTVKTEEGGELYFRFYDPRVLRVFLPTCAPGEVDEFFGPVKYYLMEEETPEVLLRFSVSSQGMGLTKLPLALEDEAKIGKE